MTTTSPVAARAAFFRRLPRSVLTIAAAISLLGLLVALAGLLLDGQTITGQPAWLKPAKFGVSITIYCVTLGWLLSLVRGHRVAVRVVSWATALALVGELALIGMQVARGTTSHFNDTTPFDAAVFSAMGGMIAVVFLAAAGAAVLLLRQDSLDRTLASGIRAGLLVCVAGMGEAGLMLANRSIAPAGAHTVGAADGGPGLPIVGWSTQYGDLRVAHFVGLHALQALPLLAWVLLRFGSSLAEQTRVRLVRTAGAAYLGLVVVLAWQAERALPLFRPDPPVLVALAAVASAAAVSAGLALRLGRVRS